MMGNHLRYLADARACVAGQVRSLRGERRWTQKELAAKIGLSQGRLSEVERGDGSFTAEQLLLLARLFNVPVSRFAPPTRSAPSEHADLQNALARLGAAQLLERDDILPSERFEDVARVVKETLLVGSPRLVVALAPVLVQQIDHVSLPNVWLELRELRLERRLAWLAENVLAALRSTLTASLPHELRARYRRADTVLQFWVADALSRSGGPRGLDGAPDLLDATIRSQRTLEQVRAAASPISNRWGIATTLQPHDFTVALEAARAGA